jgi:CRP/FNR family transcriptional regulator, cyclic AMP receptor protein
LIVQSHQTGSAVVAEAQAETGQSAAAALAAMMGEGAVRSYPKRSILITEGDRGGFLLAVLSGRVRVYTSDAKGKELTLDYCGPGEILGEMSLDGGARCASAMAVETTRCALISHAHLRERLATDPGLALDLVNLLIQRARVATRRSKDLALANVYQRVARLLETLAQPDAAGALAVRERLSQQDIAERVGASRDMVRRVFKVLIEGAYLETDGRAVRILKKLPADW